MPITTAVIYARINALTAERADLKGQSERLTFLSVSGDADATRTLEATDTRIADIDKELGRLESARAGAATIDAENRRLAAIRKRNGGLDQAQTAARALLEHAQWVDKIAAEWIGRMADIKSLEQQAWAGLIQAKREPDTHIGMSGIRRSRSMSFTMLAAVATLRRSRWRT